MVARLYAFSRNAELAAEPFTDLDRERAIRFLEKAISTASRAIDNLKRDGIARDESSLLADLLALALKSPYYADIVDVENYAAYASPFNFFLSLLIVSSSEKYRGVRKLLKQQYGGFSRTLFNVKLLEVLDELERLSQVDGEGFVALLKKAVHEDSEYWSLVKAPQDTRPGLNFGLVPHMLLTSAIAWALAVERGEELGMSPDNGRIGLIRLAALLHDVGKLIDPRRHVEAGISFLEGVASRTQSPSLSLALRLVKKHHTPAGPLGRIISAADRAASGIDRLAKYACEVLSEDIRRLGADPEKIYIHSDWGEAGKIAGEELELTRKFWLKLRERRVEPRLVEDGDVYYVVIDLGGIQNLIKRGALLQTVVAASRLIDFIVTTYIPYKLYTELGVPPEAILISAGGIVTVILPRRLLKKLEEAVDEIQGAMQEWNIPLKLLVLKSPLLRASGKGLADVEVSNISGLIEQISREKKLKKFIQPLQDEIIDYGLRLSGGGMVTPRLCQVCGLDIADSLIKPKGLWACPVCLELYNIGSDHVFRAKIKAEIKVGDNVVAVSRSIVENAEVGWENVSESIMDFISGHNLVMGKNGKVRKAEIRSMNYAALAADGDKVGKLLTEAVSLSDLYDRSLHIDISVKRGLRKALEAVSRCFGGAGAREAVRLMMGYLYSGGDDLLTLMPSYLAIPVAMILSEEYEKVMRGNTISVGIAASASRHPVWQLISAARALESASKAGGGGRISFILSEQGLLNDTVANTMLEELMPKVGGAAVKFLSWQPYTREELEKVFEILLGARTPQEVLALISAELSKARKGDPEAYERVKKMARAARRSLAEARTIFASIFKTDVHIASQLIRLQVVRQAEVAGPKYKETYEKLKSLINAAQHTPQTLPIADIYFVFKFMSGGLL